jgi:predicted lysophospholipase L1 biosynthesis ABC-type transport system permease subunit
MGVLWMRARAQLRGRARAKQPDLTDLERVGYPPGLLAGLVVLLALGTVTHALVTSVRRRRRDLATLKTLGFTRGQVPQTVAWQATTFALLALLVGVPLGVAGGRWAWRLVADQLGVVSGPVVPPPTIHGLRPADSPVG